jgi:hypothetical protein
MGAETAAFTSFLYIQVMGSYLTREFLMYAIRTVDSGYFDRTPGLNLRSTSFDVTCDTVTLLGEFYKTLPKKN